MITPEECEEQVAKKLAREFGAKKDDLQKTQVEVVMLNIGWLTANRKTFVDFVKTLRKSKTDKIYSTEIIEVLLNEFWEENYQIILYYLMTPWAVYILTMTYYYMSILQDGYYDDASSEDLWYAYLLGITFAVSLGV